MAFHLQILVCTLLEIKIAKDERNIKDVECKLVMNFSFCLFKVKPFLILFLY